ncbi:MAG TPA: hypothetical protein VMW31_06345 [Devosiaceae bacterium]|nr:hypothetical protein [Devosiaceae bacterium]
MLIKLEVLEAIRRGEIDIQFRRWQRATVKAGGTLKTRVGVLKIGAIDPVSVDQVTERDCRRAGFADRAEFVKWLDTMKPGELCRIEVSYLGEDPRVALRQKADLSAAELVGIDKTLDGYDDRADIGPWTTRFLAIIEKHPARLAEELGHELGLEKHPFKSRVRKLKALGLTESLEVGYRLSPRGRSVLKHRRKLRR